MTRTLRLISCQISRSLALSGLALWAGLMLAASPASADDYVGYRRIGSWNLAKKTNLKGKRIEMMAVAAKESEGDFFLIMCGSDTASLYVSIVTKDPSLTAEDPLRLDVGYAFDGAPLHVTMHKVLVDDKAVLRDEDKADVASLIATIGKSQQMIITAGAFVRRYDLDGFKPAFDIVDTACRKSAAS